MSEDRRRVLTDEQLTEIATGLRGLGGAQPMDSLPDLAARFGWRVLSPHADRARLDIGFGPTSGRVFAEDGRIVDITLWLTKGVPQDDEGRAWARDTFARWVALLTELFGPPTTRIPGEVSAVRWAGEDHTLILRDVDGSLQLTLMDNNWLMLGDQADALAAEESR
ncbi:DUF6301 family protein [Nocardia sp. NPDC023988]|uniref:DUF6301 family protein n=1 Tax=unclassified Nocardia TaxID=2637762 RepID=UPI0033F3B70E